MTARNDSTPEQGEGGLGPEQLRLALLDYRARLRERFGPRLTRVALYGSRARGDARADSDVDVLVLVDGATREDLKDAVALMGDTLLATHVVLSPAAYSTAQWEHLLSIESPFALGVQAEWVEI